MQILTLKDTNNLSSGANQMASYNQNGVLQSKLIF